MGFVGFFFSALFPLKKMSVANQELVLYILDKVEMFEV